MNQLYLEPTKYTPGVNFDPGAGKFEITGVSLPEDVIAFYEPILDWLDTFRKSLTAESAVNHPFLHFAYKLNYYNSGSVRYIISIMEILKRINGHTPVKVEWFYDKDDVLLFDNGKELEVLSGLKFDFIELE
jgi:hypothetical protein